MTGGAGLVAFTGKPTIMGVTNLVIRIAGRQFSNRPVPTMSRAAFSFPSRLELTANIQAREPIDQRRRRRAWGRGSWTTFSPA